MNEDFEYIINFDENKLFHTEQDDKYTHKAKWLNEIKSAKEQFKETYKKYCMWRKDRSFNTTRAFEFCNLYLTDTPHQALACYIEYIFDHFEKIIEAEKFLKYVADELKKISEVENERN